jgi:hypothetical protein
VKRISSLVSALVLALSLSACGAKVPPIPPTPAQVEQADASVKAGAIKALGILESAGAVANRASRIEEQFYKDGVIPADLHKKIQGYFQQAGLAAVIAINTIEAGAVETWAQLKALVDPVLASVNSLVDLVKEAASSVKSSLGPLVESLVDIVRGLVGSGGSPELAVEGAR